jgi:YrbI family 3-deoxy-D-manno-octulosonate 8-phosphate phosphatase
MDFKKIKMLVCDFDGVMTDNRVIVDENGKESVICHRGDGLGIESLKKNGFYVLVISKEKNKVVKARCDKLGIECIQGTDEKLSVFKKEISKRNLNQENICFIGNDVNDIECIEYAGLGVAVNDSHPLVKKVADFVTEKKGGHGAVREIADLILSE